MKKTFFLVLIISFFFICVENVKVFAFTCSPACTAPDIFCAIDPQGVETQLFNQSSSSGMCINHTPPNKICDLSGNKWCTDNIFDGWEIISDSGSSAQNNGSYFNWLTGGLSSISGGQDCLQPGDKLNDKSYTGTCSITAKVIDPVSTEPDRNFSSTSESQSAGLYQYYLKDFALEAVKDCSGEPKITLYWDTPEYANKDMNNLVIKRRKLGATPVEETVYVDDSYDGSYHSWIDQSTNPAQISYSVLNDNLYSPNFPSEYPNNYNRTWIIDESGASSIYVYFSNFEIEQDYDFVDIIDGTNTVISTYTGYMGSFGSSIVDGDSIKINFYSDDSNNATGWRIDYYISKKTNTITSPNYGIGNYDNDYDNTWTITEPGANRIRVNFSDFITEQNNDLVTIMDVNNNIINQYSGDLSATTFYSDWINGDTIKIQFNTDSSNSESGWMIDSYEYEKDAPYYQSEAQSPNFPANYSDNYDGSWTFKKTGAEALRVHFSDFYTEENNDVVEIIDGYNNVVATYSGNLGSFYSDIVNTDQIKIRFSSNGDINNSGWRMDLVEEITGSTNYPAIENEEIYEYYISTTFTGSSVPNYAIPGYRSDHVYNFPICLDNYQRIKFAANDSFLPDNIGSYTVKTCANGSCLNPEILNVPFVNGSGLGALTVNQYSGCFSIEVSGYGQASDVEYSDAFYIFTDRQHNILPNIINSPEMFVLAINNEHAINSIQYNNQRYNGTSNTVRISSQCNYSLMQIEDGFNIDPILNGQDVTLSWEAVAGAKQYIIVKEYSPIYDTNPKTLYYWNPSMGTNIDSSSTTYIQYLSSSTNSYSDTVNLVQPTDTAIYRIYAYKADNFTGSTWDSKYPWDHEYELSEEIIFHKNGNIDQGGIPVTLASCSAPCATSADCDSGLSCISSQCRNSACPTESGCACSMNPALISSLTDVLSNNFTTRPSKHTLWYDIRIDTVVTDGSLLVTFPSDFNFGSLASGDITTSGGDVTWGSPTVNAGNHTLVLPFTGALNKDDGRVTIVVGNTNFITNPVSPANYLINLTSHASIDGSGSSIDDVSDEIFLRSFDSEGSSSLSDTLSVSLTSYDSRHTLRYNIGTPPAITDGSVKVVLATEFDLSGLVLADISVLGGDVTWGTATVTPSTKTIVIPFTGTLDGSDTLITLLFGNTNFINNPPNTGSYQVRLSTHNSTDGTGSSVEDLTANVAITGGITVTATVPSSLTFTILPVSSSQSVNGTTTTTISTPSLINFGIIEPSTPKIAAHDLQVSTNSTNGFVVTLQSLSNFTSPGGNTISNFTGTNANPIDWSSPSTTHSFFGYTTADYTLHDAVINRFQSNKWAGTSTAPVEVMYYTDPIDGVGEGLTRVGYQIEIDNLQPSGIYQTNLMYLCTATY